MHNFMHRALILDIFYDHNMTGICERSGKKQVSKPTGCVFVNGFVDPQCVGNDCLAIGKWRCSTVSHRRRQDGTSCGVLVCTVRPGVALQCSPARLTTNFYKSLAYTRIARYAQQSEGIAKLNYCS